MAKNPKDQIPGGKADDRTSDEFDPKQLKMGIKVEMEHTDDPKLAEEIARDHLTEFPDYYTRLLKMEKEAEGRVMGAAMERARSRQAEKDIIRVLVQAGKEALAKSFAQSRGYRVKAADERRSGMLTVHYRGNPVPKRMPMNWLTELSGKKPGTQVVTKRVKSTFTLPKIEQLAKPSQQATVLQNAQRVAGDKHLVFVTFSVESRGGKYIRLAAWDAWGKKWHTPRELPGQVMGDTFIAQAFEALRAGIPTGYVPDW